MIVVVMVMVVMVVVVVGPVDNAVVVEVVDGGDKLSDELSCFGFTQ